MVKGTVEHKLLVVYAAFVIFVTYLATLFVGYMSYINPNVREILSVSPTLKKAIEAGEIGPVQLPCSYNSPVVKGPEKVTWTSWILSVECAIGIKYNYTTHYVRIESMDAADCKNVPYRLEYVSCPEGYDCKFEVPFLHWFKKVDHIDFNMNGGDVKTYKLSVGAPTCNVTKGDVVSISIRVYNRDYPEFSTTYEFEGEVI